MPGLDEFDELLADFRPDGRGQSESDAGGGASATDETAERRVHLVSLVEKSTGLMKQLAEEAVVALDERVAREAADASALEARSDAENDVFDWNDPGSLDALAHDTVIRREEANRAAVETMRAGLKGDPDAARKLGEFEAALEAVAAFEAGGGKEWELNPLWAEHERRVAERDRAASLAAEKINRTLEDDLREAESVVQDAYRIMAS